MNDFIKLRQDMIEWQLEARGMSEPAVIDAINAVPREKFVPAELVEFAYSDTPLPIGSNQTISQPYIVAIMVAALNLKPQDRVLEVGTGSGYAAAVLAELVAKVFTVERHEALADSARQRLIQLGYENIKVQHSDGTLGWAEHAPFDGIVVAAGGAKIPEALKEQLKIGGHLVIPIGESANVKQLLKVTRVSQDSFHQEDLGDVRFVPLIGSIAEQKEMETKQQQGIVTEHLPDLIFRSSEHFGSIEKANLDNLLARIGNSRIVLMGESTHGSAEYYEMRARISKELIDKKGFNIIAVEADWPDAAQINNYVQGLPASESTATFERFPTWMWGNQSILEFAQWLKKYNKTTNAATEKVGFYGLDLYSLNNSIQAVLSYLDSVDHQTAEVARNRYGCLTPWMDDLSLYSKVAITEQYRGCEKAVLTTLKDLLSKRLRYSVEDGDLFFNAEQNARLVANAERYYRTMYYAESNSWNQRDQHMFETLQSVLSYRGNNSKAIVWEHNSHIGDARATQMCSRGEFNVGQLVREEYQEQSYLIGFGTDHGTVMAASNWGCEGQVKQINPSHIDSYERIFHDVKTDNFLLPLRYPLTPEARRRLYAEKLERAIGVIYRPESELQSHYFYASLPHQFDEYIWFDETRAVEPVDRNTSAGSFDTFPFGV